jgi:tRNA(Ile2) C34 agmatinyltransferase TiaS
MLKQELIYQSHFKTRHEARAATQEYIEVFYNRGKRRMVKRYILDEFKCKYCGSGNLVMYGTYKGKQNWRCKDCRHKFSESTALPSA